MERPTTVTVFGILNIVFGFVGLCGMGATWVLQAVPAARAGNPVFEVADENPVFGAYMVVGSILGSFATVALIAAGIGLLLMKSWARVASVWYSVYAIGATIVGLVLNITFVYPAIFEASRGLRGPESVGAIAGVIGGTIGSLIGLAHPALMLYFMTRPHILAAFARHGNPRANEEADVIVAEEASDNVDAPPLPMDDNPYRAPTSSSAPVRSSDDAVSTLIPYRNTPALIAYYLGLFSLSACIPLLGIVGIVMAAVAVVLGIKGLRLASEDEQAKGRVHAWIGVIGGAVCGSVGLLIHILIIIALVSDVAGW